ncbi:MAG: thioredoxin family protein [Azonexus sp.]|nr:thioredoxin family protein [Azonexus sp.]
MTYNPTYAVDGPDRAEIAALPGPLLLEFGVDWCPHCQGAQPAIAAALRDYPALRHVKVEDGPGRPLGRAFRVKLWPTLILLHDGQETARVVRPTDVSDVSGILSAVAAG